MPTQSEALRLMLEAIAAMRAAGYTQEDIQELVTAAFQHLEGGVPAIRLRPLHELPSIEHRLVGLPWPVLVREPCPRCGKPW